MRGMILSAGLGERLRPVTSHIAKPALRFLNVPMLAYPLFWMEQLKLDRLVINTHYLPQTVEAAAKSVSGWDYELKFTHEKEILGSGGGIWNAREFLAGAGDFVTSNADAVMLMDRACVLNDMLAFHQKAQALATLLVCERKGAGQMFPGVWIDQLGRVKTFGKGEHAGLQCVHFAGIIIFSEEILQKLPAGSSNILYDVLLKEIAAGEAINAWVEPMHWFETGTPRDYIDATNTCLRMLFESEGARWHLVDILDRFSPGWRNFQNQHVISAEPPAFHFEAAQGATALIGRNVKVRSKIRLTGPTVINDNSELTDFESGEGVYIPEAQMWLK